jgi:hypothetical protein
MPRLSAKRQSTDWQLAKSLINKKQLKLAMHAPISPVEEEYHYWLMELSPQAVGHLN